MHRRLVEAIAREELGLPNEFFPEPKKPGEGPRLRDMRARDLRVQAQIRKLEAELNAATADLAAAEAALARGRLSDRNAFLDTLNARREAFVNEAQEREQSLSVGAGLRKTREDNGWPTRDASPLWRTTTAPALHALRGSGW